jgi:hypothetical protein
MQFQDLKFVSLKLVQILTKNVYWLLLKMLLVIEVWFWEHKWIGRQYKIGTINLWVTKLGILLKLLLIIAKIVTDYTAKMFESV